MNTIFINTSWQLGEFESGVLAAWVGAVPAAAISGIGTLLVVALWMAMFPGLRQRQQLLARAGQPICKGMQTVFPYLDHFLPAHNVESLVNLARTLEQVAT